MILGIDPSLRGSGLAVLHCEPGDQFRLMGSKTVKLHAKLPMSDCLGEIFREVSTVLGRFSVEHVAVEETIYVQNFQTAQILGAARGPPSPPWRLPAFLSTSIPAKSETGRGRFRQGQ